ncbi:MAG: TCR/Tet family MFS transporter [Polyangiaceae bacterium]
MASRRASLVFILVVLVLDTLGIGLVIPVMPKVIESFVNGDLGAASHTYGAFVAVYAAMQFVFAPVIGGLSDRFGRRVVILSSLAGAALDYLLLAFAPSLALLFVGRVIAGITGASFSAATAYIADITPQEKRAQSFGMVGAAFGIGFILGPALGGFVGDHHVRAPFVLAATLNFANFVYGLFVLPESLASENRSPFSLRKANPVGAMRLLGRSPLLRGLAVTITLSFLAQQILQSVWALHTESRFGWTPFQVGLSLTVVGITSGVVQGGLVRAVVPKLGERKSLLLGLLFNVSGFVAFGLANRGWMMYAFLVPFALGGFVGPSIQALLSREVDATEQGALQGALTSLSSVTAVFGPLLGTTLVARFGPKDAVPHVPGAAFFCAALFNGVGMLLTMRLFGRLPEKAREEP